jgi:hypothetical protein
MDPIDQINFTNQGEYYIALMIGTSMDDLRTAYLYVAGQQWLKTLMADASVEDKNFLVNMIETGGMKALQEGNALYTFSNENTIPLSEFVLVTPMFHTLFGE